MGDDCDDATDITCRKLLGEVLQWTEVVEQKRLGDGCVSCVVASRLPRTREIDVYHLDEEIARCFRFLLGQLVPATDVDLCWRDGQILKDTAFVQRERI